MSDDNGSSRLAFFVAGMGIGAILALLFAPKSGRETRDYLAHKAEEGKDFVTARSRELRQQADEFVERGKDFVAQKKEQLSAALEAGKQAYHEEKSRAR